MIFRFIVVSQLFLILFFIDGPGYLAPRPYKAGWDLGHVIVFAIWSFLLIRWVGFIQRKTFRSQSGMALLLARLFGAGIEVLQHFIGRTPSLTDISRDLLGAVIAISFLAPKRRNLPPHTLKLLQGAVVSLTILALAPLTFALTDEYVSRRDFPVLSSLESRLELARWSCKTECTIVQGIAPDGGGSLKVPLTSSTRYSGAFLDYFPRDWYGYTSLNFSIYNELTEPLDIACRVHDGLHTKGVQRYNDRFNRKFLLNQGWNELQIPLVDILSAPKGRQMDMADIRAIGFFATGLEKEVNIYRRRISGEMTKPLAFRLSFPVTGSFCKKFSPCEHG